MGAEAPAGYWLYAGTRDTGPGRGIFCCSVDVHSGVAGPVTLAAEAVLPTAFALSADGTRLYTSSETGNDGSEDGALSAYAVEQTTGRLVLLNTVSSEGGGPTHLAIDATGRHLVVASFGHGRTLAFSITGDGSLGRCTAQMTHAGTGPRPRQAAPHAHGVAISPDNRFVLSADMGADRVFVFRLDPEHGTLAPNEPPWFEGPSGAGPRQVVFHPTQPVVYLLNELDATVAVLGWSPDQGVLRAVQTVPAAGLGGSGEPSAAGMAIDPRGRHLCTTTRSDSAVEVFAIDHATGELSLKQRVDAGGELPWACTIDPTGAYLSVANLSSDALAVFEISSDGSVGRVTADIAVPRPVASVFAPRQIT